MGSMNSRNAGRFRWLSSHSCCPFLLVSCSCWAGPRGYFRRQEAARLRRRETSRLLSEGLDDRLATALRCSGPAVWERDERQKKGLPCPLENLHADFFLLALGFFTVG